MSIASLGDATLPRRDAPKFQVKRINDVSDIDGAKSGSKYHHRIGNKPQPQQSDVPGATSKPLSWSRNVRDNSLYIDDIEGTRHTIKDRMMQTKRHVNPLNPDYPLASFQKAEVPEMPFIKDPQYHNDIEGSTVQPKKQFATRDIMAIDDIEGSRPGWKPRHARARRESEPAGSALNTQDISAPKHRFKDRTTRVTDPNNPSYYVNGMHYEDDAYTKPKQQKPLIADNHLLQTKDIPGATPGWTPTYNFDRREFRNTNFIQDIEGTQADSIKHSIITKRQSNPLNPVYQALDPGELLEPLIPPLIPADLIKVPTVPVPKGNLPSAPPSSHATQNDPRAAAVESSDSNPDAFVAPVLNAAENAEKPPLAKSQFHLDLGKATAATGAMGEWDNAATFGNSGNFSQQQSPYGSGRLGEGSGRRIAAAAAAHDINANNSSARAKGSSYNKSPAMSSRSSGGASTARSQTNVPERRAQQQLNSEIDAVRGLG